jgi:hypothetical protein
VSHIDLRASICAKRYPDLYRMLREAMALHRWARGMRVAHTRPGCGGRGPAIAVLERSWP